MDASRKSAMALATLRRAIFGCEDDCLARWLSEIIAQHRLLHLIAFKLKSTVEIMLTGSKLDVTRPIKPIKLF